jgi:hypothetical protein
MQQYKGSEPSRIYPCHSSECSKQYTYSNHYMCVSYSPHHHLPWHPLTSQTRHPQNSQNPRPGQALVILMKSSIPTLHRLQILNHLLYYCLLSTHSAPGVHAPPGLHQIGAHVQPGPCQKTAPIISMMNLRMQASILTPVID